MTKQTQTLQINPANPEKETIQTAAEIIKTGGLVAFPTETVYGLGADALNPKAVTALFEAKKRPQDNPPIVHVADPQTVHSLAVQVSEKAEKLMQQFWPGPLTLVFKRSSVVPEVTTAGLDTVAVRMPKNPVALALIKACGCPIAAPSANMAGKPSPTTAAHVMEDLAGRIDAVLDGGAAEVGVESTVLDVSVEPPMLLRPGAVTLEELQQAIGEVAVHPFVVSQTQITEDQARSPGMKHKHYAPKAQLILVEGGITPVMSTVKELISIYWLNNKKVGVLATSETAWAYEADVVKSLGSRRKMHDVAANLFKKLREFDEEDIDVIISESIPPEGLGLAVMNRLRKAAGYNIIKVKKQADVP
ncbi:MAG: L-threonylcarbamoyladenylate synthase [Candidatus Bathyarchaeota archaeon]|nr:L-threonylcarbamoyladenylate synthase [Candidatus Bathyarchaeota archaeon]